MPNWSFRAVPVAVVLLCVALPRAGGAQSRAGAETRQVAPGVDSVPACCAIVRIDTVRAIVTARELGTGFTFAFEIRERRLLRGLRVGRPVWANFAARTVRLRAGDRRPCCTILPPGAP